MSTLHLTPRVFIGTNIYEVIEIDYKNQRVVFSDGSTYCEYDFEPNIIQLKFDDCIMVQPTSYKDIFGNPIYAGDILASTSPHTDIVLSLHLGDYDEAQFVTFNTVDQFSFTGWTVENVVEGHKLRVIGNGLIHQSKWSNYVEKYNSRSGVGQLIDQI